MPELPEVQIVVDTLKRGLLGARFSRVRLLRRDILEPADCDLDQQLRGRRVIEITRRGKRIVFLLDNKNQFFVHLGMTGRLTLETASLPIAKHTHLICGMTGSRRELRFRDARRFGGIWWLGANGSADDEMGPEPLTLRTADFAKRLASSTRAIKIVLLDQTVIAGIGNIYADESLFAAKIHPLAQACELSIIQVTDLNRAIKRTLRRAIHHRGSTLRDYVDAEGERGGFQRLHAAYGREGLPCERCRTPVERIIVNGRSTHFCPNCQPSV